MKSINPLSTAANKITAAAQSAIMVFLYFMKV